MPQNTTLFPTVYSNLCPGTQTVEADRISDLEQKLLILRYQYLAGLKRDGQSIAELQNATLDVANTFYLGTTVGRSFMGGGECYGVHGQIDKLTHLTETIAAQSFALTQIRHRHAGSASSNKGYWAGGEIDLVNTKTANIEAIAFDTETKSAVAATLSTPTAYFRGVYSSTKGYFGGALTGWIAGNGKIEALTFSSESVAVLGATLPSIIGGHNATQSASKGYFCSGWNNTKAINSLTFSTETTAVLGAQLSMVRLEAGNFASAAKGFFSSGITNAVTLADSTRTVEALPFSTETPVIVANALVAYADADSDGTSALKKGYSFGGVSVNFRGLDGFDFAAESMAPVGALLTRGGRYPTPVGKP